MQEFIINIMNSYGYIGVFLLILIENIFPPIPSELILLFGGFMTTYTKLNIIGMITNPKTMAIAKETIAHIPSSARLSFSSANILTMIEIANPRNVPAKQ